MGYHVQVISPIKLDDTLTEQTLATAKIFVGRVEEATSRTNAKKTTNDP